MKIKIEMSQQQLKDGLKAMETAHSILYSIMLQCPEKIKRNKVVKINVGGGRQLWKDRLAKFEVIQSPLYAHKVSERHKLVLLKPKLGLGEGFPIEIDKGVAPLVKELWKKNVRTYECCQGGYDGEEGSENDRGWIILHADDYVKAKDTLKKFVKSFKMEIGTGGYCPEEYNKSVKVGTDGYYKDKFVYVSWKSKEVA